MNNNIIGINVDEINKLMLEISDIGSNINIIFNKINELVEETKGYYVCSTASVMRNKYAMFNDNFRIIVNNIMTYNKDLIKIKRKFDQGMEILSQDIREKTATIKSGKIN